MKLRKYDLTIISIPNKIYSLNFSEPYFRFKHTTIAQLVTLYGPSLLESCFKD